MFTTMVAGGSLYKKMVPELPWHPVYHHDKISEVQGPEIMKSTRIKLHVNFRGRNTIK